jgi:ketosteroid isomerase-like protein
VAVETRQRDNMALARRLFASFEQHDLDAFLGTLHPDIEAHPSIGGGPELHGRDAVADWLQQFASTGDELEARPLDFETAGDCVIVRGYLRMREGTTLAESQTFWLCEFRDGQIVRMESHASRTTALARC